MRALIAAAVMALGAGAAHADDAAVFGNWTLHQVKDPITDQVSTTAINVGQGGTLVIGCSKQGPGSLYVGLKADTYLGDSKDYGEFGLEILTNDVVYRFDDDKPRHSQWIFNANFARDTERGNALLNFYGDVFAKSKLAIRLKTYREDTVDATFDLAGGREVAPHVLADCKALSR